MQVAKAALRPSDLNPETTGRVYSQRVLEEEEKLLCELRDQIFDNRMKAGVRLTKDQKNSIREKVLQEIDDEYKITTKERSRRRRRRGRGGNSISELALQCMSGDKPEPAKSKGKEIAGKPQAKQKASVTEKPEKAAVEDEPVEEIVYSPSDSVESEESDSLSSADLLSADRAFVSSINDIMHGIKAKEFLTEGKENEFYPHSVRATSLLAGDPEKTGPLNGLISATHEAEVIKNLAKVLNYYVAADPSEKVKPYDEELIYLLKGIWGRKDALEDFVKENETKNWDEMIAVLHKWRSEEKPYKPTENDKLADKKISEKTGSLKPGSEAKPKQLVEKTNESYEAFKDNYWMSLLFATMLQVAKRKIKERNTEIAELLKSRKLRGFEAKATTYVEEDEHVLYDSNKRPFIDKLTNFIEQVLRFKETGEMLYESMKQIGYLEEEDEKMLTHLDKLIGALKDELERLNSSYDKIKTKGETICAELGKVIDNESSPEHTPGYIAFTSKIVPAGENEERSKAAERKKIAKKVAETQKLAIEQLMINLEERMNYVPISVFNFCKRLGSGTDMSAGINEIFKRIQYQRSLLKAT